MRKNRMCFVIGLIVFLQPHLFAQEVISYPVPQSLMYDLHNDDFSVQVRSLGGEWQDVYEYAVQVDMDNPQNASLAQFDFSGTVEVKVRKNNGILQQVRIRPAIKDIQ